MFVGPGAPHVQEDVRGGYNCHSGKLYKAKAGQRLITNITSMRCDAAQGKFKVTLRTDVSNKTYNLQIRISAHLLKSLQIAYVYPSSSLQSMINTCTCGRL